MKPNIEEILDAALTQLDRGQSLSEVLATFPEHAEELKPLLEVVVMGLAIRRNIVPTPMRRYSFAERQYQSWWLSMVGFLKFGIIPLALVFAFLGAQTLINKTERSRPSQTLFTLKRASEQLQLSLTRDTNQQAALQVQFTQRRLNEVKQADSPEQEAAALAELKDQSQKTFATVPQVAAVVAITNKDSSLLNSLVAINKEQQQVLSAARDDTALQAAMENGEALAAIVATVNEQTLVDLQSKIEVTGEATIADNKTTITVDGTTFAITADTITTAPDGSALDSSQLPAKGKANVVGTKNNNKTEARIVSFLTIEPAATEETKKPTPKPAPTYQPVPQAPSTEQPDQTPPPAPDDSSNEVTSGVIIESVKQ